VINHRWLVAVAVVFLLDAAPPSSGIPPTADADIGLADGRTLHLRALPLGQMDGVVRDGVQFDAAASRVAFLVVFPGGSIDGDWRTTDPVQAYVADITRRTLVALTSDGRASAIVWTDAKHIAVTDAGVRRIVAVAAPAKMAATRARLSRVGGQPDGTLVSPPEMFRLNVFKAPDGSYEIGQVGAVRLRTVGIATARTLAVIGASLAWIDGSRRGGPPISRSGPDEVMPPSFPDSAYGSSLTPIDPLGHFVYQGAYRNGIAYFAFSFGLSRIVASTTDLVNFSYPVLPKQPAFTVGDGLGGGGDGILYFARPEDGTLQFWKGDHYAERTMQFPDDARDTHRLFEAMSQIARTETAMPPMRPDADALDSALLEWRIYPIGDVTGDAWIASYLGRAFVAHGDLQFKEIAPPAFPFAVLGRTDDGRIWGATPISRTVKDGWILSAMSRLYSTRDGTHWAVAATLAGDPDAVGLHEGIPWVAMSAFEQDADGVEVVRLDQLSLSAAAGAPTGAVYAGEDLLFADVATGFYLVCGGAPGTRTDDQSGPYVAVKLDASRLFARSGDVANSYLAERLDPEGLQYPSPPSRDDASALAFFKPSTSYLAGLVLPGMPTITSNLHHAYLPQFRSLTLDDEREFEVEYAWRPIPISNVIVQVSGDTAVVDRMVARGALSAEGWTERWKRDATGAWQFQAVTSRWRI
jgi:hypothetical protein